MGYETRKRQYTVCGQVFESDTENVVKISVAEKYARAIHNEYRKTGNHAVIVLEAQCKDGINRISYLLSPQIVQLGIINNKTNRFIEVADPSMLYCFSSMLKVSGSQKDIETTRRSTIRSQIAWGKEIVRRRERGIVLEPTIEATGDEKHDAMANERWKQREKDTPYGNIDAELHTIRHRKNGLETARRHVEGHNSKNAGGLKDDDWEER